MSSVHDFTAQTIHGQDSDLADYAGKALLVVNVASECGLTPQYADLEALHRQYTNQGLAVLGFPCNQFKGQEPGNEEQILDFCQTRYDVSFPLFSKIEVNGPNRHPL
ncbi:MAG: glutathione peroxidase, partial [Gemmatimonadetes bacterium]|nr:glutathione peroxidase [Gemmatimonadota bacterium]